MDGRFHPTVQAFKERKTTHLPRFRSPGFLPKSGNLILQLGDRSYSTTSGVSLGERNEDICRKGCVHLGGSAPILCYLQSGAEGCEPQNQKI